MKKLMLNGEDVLAITSVHFHRGNENKIYSIVQSEEYPWMYDVTFMDGRVIQFTMPNVNLHTEDSRGSQRLEIEMFKAEKPIVVEIEEHDDGMIVSRKMSEALDKRPFEGIVGVDWAYEKKCTCDYETVIRIIGCQCGGK